MSGSETLHGRCVARAIDFLASFGYGSNDRQTHGDELSGSAGPTLLTEGLAQYSINNNNVCTWSDSALMEGILSETSYTMPSSHRQTISLSNPVLCDVTLYRLHVQQTRWCGHVQLALCVRR